MPGPVAEAFSTVARKGRVVGPRLPSSTAGSRDLLDQLALQVE